MLAVAILLMSSRSYLEYAFEFAATTRPYYCSSAFSARFLQAPSMNRVNDKSAILQLKICGDGDGVIHPCQSVTATIDRRLLARNRHSIHQRTSRSMHRARD